MDKLRSEFDLATRPGLVATTLQGFADLLDGMVLANAVGEEAHRLTLEVVTARIRGLAAFVHGLTHAGTRGAWPILAFAEVGVLADALERLVRLRVCQDPQAHDDLVLVTTGIGRLAEGVGQLLGCRAEVRGARGGGRP